ncbi:MAG: hypothetical protein HOP30_03770 [Cyclobacteriaceae bacterium]|nr:hypothetical protein [Cyclobacteriaceae bacterium]
MTKNLMANRAGWQSDLIETVRKTFVIVFERGDTIDFATSFPFTSCAASGLDSKSKIVAKNKGLVDNWFCIALKD